MEGLFLTSIEMVAAPTFWTQFKTDKAAGGHTSRDLTAVLSLDRMFRDMFCARERGKGMVSMFR